MNWTLLLKELWELRICFFLVLAIYGCGELYELATGFPDLPTPDESGDEAAVFTSVLFGIIVGGSLIGAERDPQLRGFLDGLPVSRTTVFLHKMFAAFIAVLFEICVALTLWFFLVWMASTSVSQTIPQASVWTLVVTRTILGITITGIAVLLSFSRQWFPLVTGLALLGTIWLRSTSGEFGAWIDSTKLVAMNFRDDSLIDRWQQIVGHGLIAVAAWSCTAIAFQWRDGFVSRGMDRMADSRFAGGLVWMGRLVAVLVWIYAVNLSVTEDGSVAGTPLESASGKVKPTSTLDAIGTSNIDTFSKYESRYYEMVYRGSQKPMVDSLFWSMDEVHEQVRLFFQHPPAPSGRIVVDLGSVVSAHAAGQANWTKIRIPLNEASSVDFLQILRHETAHVYIEQISDGRARDHFNAMRMFHEGIATEVELGNGSEAVRLPRQRMNRCAAAIDARGRVSLNVLCNDDFLKRTRHGDVVYPLGFVVANALIEVGGPTLPRRMLEALRDTKMPPGVKPAELWRIVLQKCGTSFDMVIAAYETRLDALAESEKDFVAKLPRLTGKVTVEGDEIVVRAEQSFVETSATMVCMIERDRVVLTEAEYVAVQSDGSFRIPRGKASGSKFRYLLGWRTDESAMDIFEPWAETSLN